MTKDYIGGTEASAWHCWRYISAGAGTGPTTCHDPIKWAGIINYAAGDTWLAFSCDGHESGLTNLRSPNAQDLIELKRRKTNSDAALHGKPWSPPKPIRRSGRQR